MSDREIPEDVFRRDFGGEDLQIAMSERRSERASRLAAGGVLAILLAPVVMVGIGVAVATLKYCDWGMRC
jgi:hypothetical protein